MVVAGLTLSVRQTPPPTIAEFAPQAVEQITDAPSEQAWKLGGGRGRDDLVGDLGDPVATSAGLTPDPLDVPRVRRCVGDPPRQIEDPQSPPCVPYWEGDNGGETWRGVTRDQIRIAFPHVGEDHPILRDWEAFFNSRFEFYGRRIHLIGTAGDHASFGSQEKGSVEQTQAAEAAYEERQVFASSDSQAFGGQIYRKELARRGIVSSGHQTQFTEAELAANHPYMWQYPMANDRAFANLGNWACRRLAGRNTSHAGDPLLQRSERVWGILTTDPGGGRPVDSSPLERELAACGQEVLENHHLGDINDDGSPGRDSGAVVAMRSSGVTSVFCLCNIFHIHTVMAHSTNQGYFPEWLTGNYFLGNVVWWTSSYPKEQSANLFGLTHMPRDTTWADDPAIWALKEVNPDGYDSSSTTNSPSTRDGFQTMYRNLLLLASGIQLAGPTLTPTTFARGLQRTVFPNSKHPNMAGAVGFGGGSHSMTLDSAELWWSNSDRNAYGNSPGAFCFVDAGRRHRMDAYPQGPGPFFSGPCHSGTR